MNKFNEKIQKWEWLDVETRSISLEIVGENYLITKLTKIARDLPKQYFTTQWKKQKHKKLLDQAVIE